jgi:hypothetical protein
MFDRKVGIVTYLIGTRQETCELFAFNNYNYSYSLHRFTTHKPETCLLVRITSFLT